MSAPWNPSLRPPMISQDPETSHINQKFNYNKNVLNSAYLIKENRTDVKSHRMGATLGPPGGL